jgi:hypothetical protein
MKWFPIVSAIALAAQLLVRAGTDRPDTSGGVLTLPSAGSRSEAVPGVVVSLPGPAAAAAAPLYPPEFERDSMPPPLGRPRHLPQGQPGADLLFLPESPPGCPGGPHRQGGQPGPVLIRSLLQNRNPEAPWGV